MKQMIVNRRRFLHLSGIGLSAATLAACVSPAPAVQTSKDAFVTYPWEFWHYNQGDAYDHYLNRTGQPARYGAVNVSLTDGRVEAIADPLTPLNSYKEIESELNQALERRRKG